MIKRLYSIRDRLVEFGPIFEAVSDAVAIRQFQQAFRGVNNDSCPLEDLELYFVGTFNTESAGLWSPDCVSLIYRGSAMLVPEVQKDEV